MRVFSLFIIFIACYTEAMTLDQIVFALQKREIPNNIDAAFTTTVEIMGHKTVVESKILQKGNTHSRLETVSSVGHTIVLRNETGVIAINGKTGEKLLRIPELMNQYEFIWSYSKVFQSGNYIEPVIDGTLFRIDQDSNYAIDGSLKSVWYDPAKNQIVKMKLKNKDGVNSVIEIDWDINSNWSTPHKTVIKTGSESEQSTITVEYTRFLTPKKLPDMLFSL